MFNIWLQQIADIFILVSVEDHWFLYILITTEMKNKNITLTEKLQNPI